MEIAGEQFEEANVGAWRVVCLALAAGMLGHGLQRRDGLFDYVAFVYLSLSLLFCLMAFLRVRIAGGRWVIGLVWVLIVWQFVQMFVVEHPGSGHAPVASVTYRLLLGIFAASAMGVGLACLSGRDDLGRRIFLPVCLLAYLVLGWWWIRVTPHPFIDVWEAQRCGLEAFCAGKSPFNAPFPDIYHHPEGYAPGTVVRNGMVELGFPYPPLTLLVNLPGHLLLGDFRYSNLVCIAAAAGLIGYSRRGAISMLAAVLFLSTPRTLFILEDGFTEPGAAMLLGATIFCACRRWRVTPVLVGLLFASKQYLIIAAPCALLLIPRPWTARTILRWVGIAALAGLAVTVPFIVHDVRGFIRCTITPSANAYFRYDALSFLALYAERTGVTPNGVIGFGLALLMIPLVLWRGARSPAGFAMGMGLVFMFFFAFGKGAFCNYYYLIIACFCAAIAGEEAGVAHALSGKSGYDAAKDPENRNPCPTH